MKQGNVMQNAFESGPKFQLHFVDPDTQIRAELMQTGLALGCHCELYEDFSELAAYPPRSGVVIFRDLASYGGAKLVSERLLSLGIWLPVVAMEFSPDTDRIVAAIKEGALDYLVLPVRPERLAACIKKVRNEAEKVSFDRHRALQARQLLSSLSGREREVLQALTEGGSNKQIARQLDISPRTVEIHRANLMSKLGAKHAVDAVRITFEAHPERIVTLV